MLYLELKAINNRCVILHAPKTLTLQQDVCCYSLFTVCLPNWLQYINPYKIL